MIWARQLQLQNYDDSKINAIVWEAVYRDVSFPDFKILWFVIPYSQIMFEETMFEIKTLKTVG